MGDSTMNGQWRSAPAESKWLTLVGLDESGWSGLGEPARRAIERAELLVGGARHLDHMPSADGQERLCWPSPIAKGLAQIAQWRGRRVCVLASGDPFNYGIGATLARYFSAAEMHCLPGPSAFSLAAARLGWSLASSYCCSVLARDVEALRPALWHGRQLLVLSENGDSPAQVAELLCQAGFSRSTLHVFEALGGPDERHLSDSAQAWRDRRCAALNTIAVSCVADLPEAGLSRSAGRDEADFSHDGQISKREVRAVILAMLAPRGGELLWDLGAGSGAVSVEWLLSEASNRAIAVERRAERVANIRDNARRYGLTQLQLVQGCSAQALAELEVPQAIFIGGGLTTPGLLEGCWQALRGGGRIVASAVTLEGEAALWEASQRYGGQLSRISVERSEALGSFTGWRPLRPVSLWLAQRPVSCEEER